MAGTIPLGFSDTLVELVLKRANRHGIVAGATGTGKTVTLQAMAQAFSDAGVPVFAADIKGDLCGIAMAGEPKDFVVERWTQTGRSFAPAAAPVILWDLFGDQGHPVRASVSEMGPTLLARLMDLNDTQEGVLTIAFKLADDDNLLLIDLKDLQALLKYMAENAKEISAEYGNVTAASIASIQRELLQLEQQGAGEFFGEPALELRDLMRTTADGKGYVSLLAADKLIASPKLYSTFLLWLLSELFEQLPEVGDPEKPRLVFFFDEAHLLFRDAPKALLEKIEQVVRLIRSKGVGIYFVTQNPADIPDAVLAQLGNRMQHALRAYTPAEQKGVRAAAQSFRPNPAFDTETVIGELAVGEALVSTLDATGTPTVVQRTRMCPPASRLGPITPAERQTVLNQSPVLGVYDKVLDRDSAFEHLAAKAAERTKALEMAEAEAPRREERAAPRGRSRQGLVETMAKSAVRQVGSTLVRELMRGVLGSLKNSRR